MTTKQMEVWSGSFGEEYSRRNTMSAEEFDAMYKDMVGTTRSELNLEFLGHLPKDIRILEVGTNIGNQLLLLQTAGFQHLYGVELQWGAIDIARQRMPRANIVQGNAFEIPFRDQWFDVVYTSGVLIHIGPSDLPRALKEIHRCSSRFLWGCEYWAPQMTEVSYHNQSGLLWKTDYAATYRESFPELRVVRERKLPINGTKDVDTMFLLEKPSRGT